MSLALVFPGQGSQSLKMMDGLINFTSTQDTFAIAQEVLGIDFLTMLQEPTADNINQTVNTQPLMLIAGYATYLAWIGNKGKVPAVVAGHSLGEWTALVASGVLEFADALRLVKLRAEAMQEAVAPGAGAMAAVIGIDDAQLVAVCQQVSKESGGVVAGVNFNSPGQVVIAGDKATVDLAANVLKENGARRVQILPVSVPSHCSLMLPASNKLAQALTTVKFKAPQIPVVHNYNTQTYTDEVAIKDALVKQLYSPVLWTNTINKMVAQGITKIVECGPGKVLTGLNKRINETIVSYTLHNKVDLEKAVTELE
jgi:[acyl-carrier-protein] S-malonyltransferase